METACLRHTELPHTSKLFSDFLYHHDRVQRFFEVAGHAKFPQDRRAALVAALREQNGDSPSLHLLAQPDTVAIVTGQQAGLFSGPAYTIYKALTAARHARELTAEGTPAVPVFWLATEDHDFAEVNHSWSFGADNQPVALRVDGHVGQNEPVGAIAIEQWPLDELRASFGDLPFADDVADLVTRTYKAGTTMGEGFRNLLQQLLKPYGLLFLDPLCASVRKLAAPILREAVLRSRELNSALLDRNGELEAAGYHAQVHIEPKTSLVFLLEGGKRIALKNGQLQTEYTGRAEQLSPNAVLRPVVQDYMIPTAAYIGGPAEIAYLAQSQVIYEKLLGYMPRLIHRSGFTLFDARSQKLMDRYRIRAQDFFHGEEFFRERMACALVPKDLKRHVSGVSGEITTLLAGLHRSLAGFDPTLVAGLEKSRGKILHQITKTEAKVAREVMRRDERAAKDARYLYGGMFPNKHLQERFYSILPFLARHGMDLIDRIYEHVHLDCPDHILLTV